MLGTDKDCTHLRAWLQESLALARGKCVRAFASDQADWSCVDTNELLRLAIEAAEGAGRILLDGRPNPVTRSVVSSGTKTSPTDVVTERDLASEKFLVDFITSHRPNDGIVGEEGTNKATSSGLNWVIDPLDGTVNYFYGFDVWSVSIAVVDEVGPLVGVVYAPVLQRTYWAIRGEGAFLRANGSDQRLPGVIETDLAQALVATGFGYRQTLRTAQAEVIHSLLPEIRDLRRVGSAALDLCMVAAGYVNAYFERGAHAWDFTAGALVATEAGAVVSGLRGKGPSVEMVVAAPPALHAKLVARLEQLKADQLD